MPCCLKAESFGVLLSCVAGALSSPCTAFALSQAGGCVSVFDMYEYVTVGYECATVG